MGQLDQLAKRILREETGAATQERVAFEVPREVPVGALAPDGVVRVVRAEGLAGLPAPWCRLGVEATLDVKMPGDHTDRAALARNELRRHARWTELLEGDRERARKSGVAAPTRDPRRYTAWLVAPSAMAPATLAAASARRARSAATAGLEAPPVERSARNSVRVFFVMAAGPTRFVGKTLRPLPLVVKLKKVHDAFGKIECAHPPSNSFKPPPGSPNWARSRAPRRN